MLSRSQRSAARVPEHLPPTPTASAEAPSLTPWSVAQVHVRARRDRLIRSPSARPGRPTFSTAPHACPKPRSRSAAGSLSACSATSAAAVRHCVGTRAIASGDPAISRRRYPAATAPLISVLQTARPECRTRGSRFSARCRPTLRHIQTWTELIPPSSECRPSRRARKPADSHGGSRRDHLRRWRIALSDRSDR